MTERHLFALAAALAASPAFADAPLPLTETEQATPALPAILAPRERAALENRILAERLDTIIPQIMRAEGIDLWLLVAREYFEEPVVATMLDAENMHARRRTILIFHDPGEGKPVERLTVSRYGLGGLFAPAWNPDQQPDQWKAVAEIIAARNPQKIAINSSDLYQFADGMTLSQYDKFMAALPPALHERVTSGEGLAIRWLETRTPAEMDIYPTVVRIAHAVIGEAFSRKVITPGKTTAEEVQWWYRDRLMQLGLTPWFHPSVAIQRQGREGMIEGDEVIQPGDLLWTDFGITYLRLNTDTQHLAYVLKPGETEAPAGLRAGLANSNKVQDFLRAAFKTGRSGNEALAEARAKAIAALEAVQIRDPARVMEAYPHELSGGMGQRVMIAMMLIPNPDLLIADEPTSALDVTVQAEVLSILDGLVRDRGMGLIFISHDLRLVSRFCDRVLVMY
ncbi:MAG TPA: ATP-binding cassette domain-containing protein, partial [Erythrobacter sp.]